MPGCGNQTTSVTGFGSQLANIQATKLKRQCVRILRSAVTSHNIRIRLSAALALCSVRDQVGLDDAQLLMAERQKEIAMRTAYYLVRNGLQPTRPAMAEALAMSRRGKGTLRQLAITVLGASLDADTNRIVTETWHEADDPYLQTAAAAALARRGNATARAWLIRNTGLWLSYDGFDPFLFARIADDTAVLKLINALAIGAEDSVRNAIIAAEVLKDSRTVSQLAVLLGRTTGSIQVMAAATLAQLNARDGEALLKQVVSQKNLVMPDAIWAAMGLASLGDPSGLAALSKLLDEEDLSKKAVEDASLILPCLSNPNASIAASLECWFASHL